MYITSVLFLYNENAYSIYIFYVYALKYFIIPRKTKLFAFKSIKLCYLLCLVVAVISIERHTS